MKARAICLFVLLKDASLRPVFVQTLGESHHFAAQRVQEDGTQYFPKTTHSPAPIPATTTTTTTTFSTAITTATTTAAEYSLRHETEKAK